ncbi:transposase IS1182 family protein [Paenibacillus mucilaginosus 3016]|uniref:Transposase IS1182 family protein n=1 Tax=Paenibacillus mucilaginosus 3016 TaxID=1116391 RepID=H6NNY8_9BACL|nr:transposase IS1182 family protein [Paenibacillus mucilaginosus 3016]
MHSIRQEELFSLQELMEMVPENKYSIVFKALDLLPALRILNKRTHRGRPEELNYAAMGAPIVSMNGVVLFYGGKIGEEVNEEDLVQFSLSDNGIPLYKNNDPPFKLPDLGELHLVTNLTLHNAPLGQPISLDCLDRFPNLNSLS